MSEISVQVYDAFDILVQKYYDHFCMVMGREGYDMRGMMYIIAGLGILSVLTKFIVSRVYKHLIRAAGHMGKSEQPLMKMLLHKFETCYQLKMGVENVEVFVDKYLNSLPEWIWPNGKCTEMCGLELRY